MKLATYSKYDWAPKVAHVEDRETSSIDWPSMLEYNEHERNTDWRHRDGATMKCPRRFVNPVRANGGYGL